MEVLYHIRPLFWWYIPLHSPYIGLIYGRYLQFGFLEWQLKIYSVYISILQLGVPFSNWSEPPHLPCVFGKVWAWYVLQKDEWHMWHAQPLQWQRRHGSHAKPNGSQAPIGLGWLVECPKISVVSRGYPSQHSLRNQGASAGGPWRLWALFQVSEVHKFIKKTYLVLK